MTPARTLDLNDTQLCSRWLPGPPAPEPGRSSYGKSAESDVSSVDYVGSRTRCEQSSIIFEHCSTLFELCSMSSGRITIAKPSGLGMVSKRAHCTAGPIDAASGWFQCLRAKCRSNSSRDSRSPSSLSTTDIALLFGSEIYPLPCSRSIASQSCPFHARPSMNCLRSWSTKVWPDYSRSLTGAPPSLQGSGPDRSMADFIWCMTAIDWGWGIEETATKLLEVSEKSKERFRLKDEGYALITAQNAAAAVERNTLKWGRW